jgi:hypothetical protein
MMAKKKPRPHSESDPKTTRPEATSRREPEPAVTTEQAVGRKLDTQPDRVDLRDWFYQPRLSPLPDILVNCNRVPDILDQGKEGACTGFALAAVINYLLTARNLKRKVSPRMLYEMARRYDEWPGESYEGSSARGAMIGWVKHGVCSDDHWPHTLHGPQHFTQERENEGRLTPGGAFFRVMHRQVRDMHAALNEVGILYVTLMVHPGWAEPGPETVEVHYVQEQNSLVMTLPVIQRSGKADGGHAVAIVGYTSQGFIVQNSWGKSWGRDGFALLPYDDYMQHATDVWVAQLGVPVNINVWVQDQARETSAGLQQGARAIPLSEIRPYVIDVGNNGELSMSGDYWTTEADLQRLFTDAIPTATEKWKKKRVLLYLHGGLNDEQTVARRVLSFRDVLLANEIYPLHVMWETGAMETLRGIIDDWAQAGQRAADVADWLRKLREGATEAKDRTLELTASLPGTMLWDKMKQNALSSSRRRDHDGAMQLLLKHVKEALAGLEPADLKTWELHVVGHSAGSIFAAYALPLMADAGITFKTIQFMAPAITVDDFKTIVVPSIQDGKCPHPTLYILSEVGERDDDVGPYGKSLLYLVSNAFEGKRGTPILGMERFISHAGMRSKEKDEVDPEVEALFKKKVNGLPSLVIAGQSDQDGCRSRSESHGGFDNDKDTLNSMLYRILGKKAEREFRLEDTQY